MRKYGIMLAGILTAVIFCGCGKKATFAELMAEAEKYAIEGKWEEALDYSKKARKLQQNSPEAIILTTLAYEKNGKINEALEEIRKAVKIAPNEYFVQYTYGRILYRFKKNDQSIEALKKALQLRPESTEARALLARIATEQKEMTTALSSFSKLAKDDEYKNKAVTWNEIGIYFLQTKKDPKTALNYAYKAYNLEKRNPAVVLNFAILCDKNNRIKQAKAFYQYYLALTKRDSSLAKKRAAVEARLKKL